MCLEYKPEALYHRPVFLLDCSYWLEQNACVFKGLFLSSSPQCPVPTLPYCPLSCITQDQLPFITVSILLLYSFFNMYLSLDRGFPGSSEVKNPPANAGDVGSIPGPGISLWRRK